MNLSFLFILIPTLCYAGAATVYAFKHNWPLVIVYSGYAWANLGLLWLDRLMNRPL